MKNIYREDYGKVIKEIKVNFAAILLFFVDDTKVPPEEGIENLIALSNEGELIWKAEIPYNRPYSYYNDFELFENKLFAWCGSMRYEISLENGKILGSKLLK